MLAHIKKCIPLKLFGVLQQPYHYALNFFAAAYYRFPSEKMIVVGVTGTTGKTTVTYIAAQMLKNAGVSVGYTSTAMFGDGKREWLNDKKMTMLGRFFTQRMLAQMVKNGCRVALVETTSQGIEQYRHAFINYDTVIFTGLYPEHIDAHGSFANYKNAKLKLVSHLARSAQKKLELPSGQYSKKSVIVNGDDEHAHDFLACDVPTKIAFTQGQANFDATTILPYTIKEVNRTGVMFSFDKKIVQLNLFGAFSATNAMAAAALGRALGLSDEMIIDGLERIDGIPGRIERIELGQDFTVIVDYAFEPVAVASLYEAVSVLSPGRIIHVLGSTGGGRDMSRREALGKLAGEKADIVIVTNEDPYDDDPMEIIRDVATGAIKTGKKVHVDLFLIEERKQAIEKALHEAHKGDLVLITGKGCEQAIAVAQEKTIPWDDREVVREYLSR